MAAGRAPGLILALCVAAGAAAHPRGAHKRVLITVEARKAAVLLVLDLDGGPEAKLLRSGSDLDGDGLLRGEEVTGLKRRLAALARAHFSLELAGAVLKLPDGEVRFSLRQDPAAFSETGLSVAVLAELEIPARIRPGMELVIRDRAPDGSPVDVEISEQGASEADSSRRKFVVTDGGEARVRVGKLRGG